MRYREAVDGCDLFTDGVGIPETTREGERNADSCEVRNTDTRRVEEVVVVGMDGGPGLG